MLQGKVVGIVYNERNPQAVALAQQLSPRYCSTEGSWVCPADQVNALDHRMPSTSVVITLGGDGTILRAAHVAAPHAVPILGVNLGRVGFMTELPAEAALDGIASYLQEDQRWIEERAMLQVEVHRGSRGPQGAGDSKRQELSPFPVHALNDVFVGRGAITRIMQIEAKVDDQPFLTYSADGVVVATATGSTGYTLSVGGPVIHPQSRDILLTAVAPHLSFRGSLLLPASSVVELIVRSQMAAVLSVDGGMDMTLTEGDSVQVRQSPYRARFLRAQPPTYFYRTLTRRLGLDLGPGASRSQESSR